MQGVALKPNVFPQSRPGRVHLSSLTSVAFVKGDWGWVCIRWVLAFVQTRTHGFLKGIAVAS